LRCVELSCGGLRERERELFLFLVSVPWAIIFSVPGWLPNRGVDNTQVPGKVQRFDGCKAHTTIGTVLYASHALCILPCHATRAKLSKSKSN
jgi:hypothetical protein